MASKIKEQFLNWLDKLLGLTGAVLKKYSPNKYGQLKQRLIAWESSKRKQGQTRIPYRIRPAKSDDKKTLIKLLNQFFVETNDRGWDWKYRDNPLGSEILVAENEAGEVVGQFAVLPQSINYYSQSRIAHQITEIGIEEAYQGQGFLEKGFKVFISRADFFPWGFVGEKLDYAYGKAIPQAGAVQDNKTHHFQALQKKLAWRYKLKKIFWPTKAQLEGLAIEPLTDRGEEIDRLWSKKRGEIRVGVVRDWRFLKWRLRDSMIKSDIFLLKAQTETIGYFALRNKGLIAEISDLLIINQHLNHSIIAMIEDFCHTLGFKKIKLVCTDQTLLKIFNQRDYTPGKKLHFTYNDYRQPVDPQDLYLTLIDADWEMGI